MGALMRTNDFREILAGHAARCPEAIALAGEGAELTYARLLAKVAQAQAILREKGVTRLAILADNGIDWAVADLAALCADIPTVPLPHFFSDQQIVHAAGDSRCDAMATDSPARLRQALGGRIRDETKDAIGNLSLLRLHVEPAHESAVGRWAKITYTSGSTGQPKGVCLRLDALKAVTRSLAQVSAAQPQDRHLCVLPLSTLLENIAGLYVPLWAGATSCTLPLNRVGLHGAACVDAHSLARALSDRCASSAILTPQLLKELAMAIDGGAPRPRSLRFLAVGGAPVPVYLLDRARELGLPVFQGYGLSECASVVALNLPGANKVGSVGRPLPHVRVRIADDGEIMVGGESLFTAYLGSSERAPGDGYWPTGDIGHLDEDGYLHVTGRKKNIFITAFGRNISPEWLEGELMAQPEIAQACVFGEGSPWNGAVIVARASDGNGGDAVAHAVARVNEGLPDYARIKRWLIADAPFTSQNGMATANGRVRRETVRARYETLLRKLFEEDGQDDVL